jgi:hypothetical protein
MHSLLEDRMHDEQRHKVDILFKEYETLRQEVLARSGQRFALVTVAGGLMAFLLKTEDWPTFVVNKGWTQATLALLCAAALLVIWWRFQFLIERLGTGISRVEQRINALTGDAELLRWEADQESQRSQSGVRKAMALLLFWKPVQRR